MKNRKNSLRGQGTKIRHTLEIGKNTRQQANVFPNHIDLIFIDTSWFVLVFGYILTCKNVNGLKLKKLKTKWRRYEHILSCFWFFSKFKASTVLNLNTLKNYVKSKSIDWNQSRRGLEGKIWIFLSFSNGWRMLAPYLVGVEIHANVVMCACVWLIVFLIRIARLQKDTNLPNPNAISNVWMPFRFILNMHTVFGISLSQ